MMGPNTIVLSLQNGWGNAALISKLTGPERLLVGVSYHSAVLLAPGHVLHAGQGPTYLGELDGTVSPRVTAIAKLFGSAGIEHHSISQRPHGDLVQAGLECRNPADLSLDPDHVRTSCCEHPKWSV